jgi:signal transduction histidine kinase
MMQATDLVFDMVLLFTFITFYGTIAWGLIRYSKRQGYRLWAIGWLVYSLGALQGGFASSPSGLALIDLVAINCMFIGITLIHDGIRATELTSIRLRLYAAGVIFFTSYLIIGYVIHLGFQLVFIPLGFYIIYVCLLSARTVLSFESTGDISNIWLVIGLLVWAGSWLVVPFTIPSFELFDFFVILQALGVIITGAAMLTMFTGTVTNDLEIQYQISQIISGLVQHDIRNYIQTARHALELTEGEDVVENHWIDIATNVLVDAGHFVDEMRDISVSISQIKAPSEKTPLLLAVDKARERVEKEYKLSHEQIQTEIPHDIMIEHSRLVDELLWNIFDNAFKHGSPSLLASAKIVETNGFELEISDRGSGLSDKIKTFLNSRESLSTPDSPLVGLGVLLIRGIASLLDIQLVVSDNIHDMSVPGTTYCLRFNGSH